MNIIIDGKNVEASVGETILDVCKREGVEVPTLCYLQEVGPTSNCRICLVELVGSGKLVTACSYKVTEGLEILTNSERVRKSRKTNLELLLSNHNYDCENCVRENNCELQALALEYDADATRFKGEKTQSVLDVSDCLVRDNSKCILCKKCVQVCDNIQAVDAIKETKRGFETAIGTAFGRGMEKSSCVGCGQCVKVCPTGALSENQHIKDLEALLADKTKVKVVAPAPAVRVAIMDYFGLTDARLAEKKLPAILRAIGFDFVFDINFGADLTVVEESREFLDRLKQKKNLPMFTSCCPAWVDYAKKFYPELVPNISTCKSPLMMFGAVVKTYWAEISNTYPDIIRVVSVMPCTAKKRESNVVSDTGDRDVDLVITVRELLYLIKKKHIGLETLVDSEFDNILGESSGAGVIFGASGGVMEASIRTILKSANASLKYSKVDGIDGAKIAQVMVDGKEIKVAVVSGLGNAKKLIEKIRSKEIDIQFVEVMACPMGCVNGGGMPINSKVSVDTMARGLGEIDYARGNRLSHKNAAVDKFVKWKSAGGKVSLHTSH